MSETLNNPHAVSATRESSEETIRTIVIEMLEQGDDLMRTIAERWVEEGRMEGETIGFEKGEQKGAHEEALHLLLRTLPRIFGDLPPAVIESIHQLSLEQLRLALDTAFEVENVDQFGATLAEWLAPPPE